MLGDETSRKLILRSLNNAEYLMKTYKNFNSEKCFRFPGFSRTFPFCLWVICATLSVFPIFSFLYFNIEINGTKFVLVTDFAYLGQNLSYQNDRKVALKH